VRPPRLPEGLQELAALLAGSPSAMSYVEDAPAERQPDVGPILNSYAVLNQGDDARVRFLRLPDGIQQFCHRTRDDQFAR
jgi:hypothetical protein